jgi:hypothetical protein
MREMKGPANDAASVGSAGDGEKPQHRLQIVPDPISTSQPVLASIGLHKIAEMKRKAAQAV